MSDLDAVSTQSALIIQPQPALMLDGQTTNMRHNMQEMDRKTEKKLIQLLAES